MSGGKYVENQGVQNLPHSLERDGCRVIGLDVLESNFKLEDTGRKLMLLLDLENVNNLMASGANVDRTLELAMTAGARNTGAEYVSLLFKDAVSGEWTTAATHGHLEPPALNVCTQIVETECSDIFEKRNNLVPCSDRLVINGRCIVLLCVPIAVDSHFIGCIMFVRNGDGPFSVQEVTLASMIGQWCNIKLSNAGLLKELQIQREHEQQLLSKICQSQTEERRRVAGELHDSVAQWLVSAAYDVGACQLIAAQKPDTGMREELQRVKETIQRSIEEIRRIISNLRPPPIIDLGLIGAINQLANNLAREGIRCEVLENEELPRLSMAEENTIFWIVQEAINNIRKHASAHKAAIEFVKNDGSLTVKIYDDGHGFDPERVARDTAPLLRVGLTGMRERAELLGGTLDVISRPDAGTRVEFTFRVNSSFAFQVAAA